MMLMVVMVMVMLMVAMVMMMLMVVMVMVMLMVPTHGRNAELPLLEDVGDAVEGRVGANDEGIRAPIVVQVEANDGHVRGQRHRSRHCRRRCIGRSISHRGCVCHRRCCACGDTKPTKPTTPADNSGGAISAAQPTSFVT